MGGGGGGGGVMAILFLCVYIDFCILSYATWR